MFFLSSNGDLPLNQLVPRLWPFLGHASSSVRKATLQTLQALLAPQHSQVVRRNACAYLQPIFRAYLVYLNGSFSYTDMV